MKSSLVHIKLDASKFQKYGGVVVMMTCARYHCSVPSITKHVHIPTISSCLKCVRSGDVLTFAISDVDNDAESSKYGNVF